MKKHHTKEKGDLAVCKIIADLTEKGFYVFVPVATEHLPFDIIAYDLNNLKSHRIQCKHFTDPLLSSKYDYSNFEYFGLWIASLNICIYPSISFMGKTIRYNLPKSNSGFYWYEDFLNFTDNANKKHCKDFGILIPSKKKGIPRIEIRKVERPSKEELLKVIWQIPKIKLAKIYGVSDKAIYKWCKFYGIEPPPRDYWSKNKSIENLASLDGFEPPTTDLEDRYSSN